MVLSELPLKRLTQVDDGVVDTFVGAATDDEMVCNGVGFAGRTAPTRARHITARSPAGLPHGDAKIIHVTCPHEQAEILTEEEYDTRRFEDPETRRIVNERVLVSFRAVLQCAQCGAAIPLKVVSHQKPRDVG